MSQSTGRRIRLQNIKIENFKVLDSIEMDFPEPRMQGDLDAIVMGSRNGLGKTSVLECCSLLFLGASVGVDTLHFPVTSDVPFHPLDLLVRCGQQEARIKGTFMFDTLEAPVTLVLSGEAIAIKGQRSLGNMVLPGISFRNRDELEGLLFSLLGCTSDPLLIPPFLYFHSYRKVVEGYSDLGILVKSRDFSRYRRSSRNLGRPVSEFKVDLLRSMMSKADLFENAADSKGEESLETLNRIVKRYAHGTVTKLRAAGDNTVDIRVLPDGASDSFTFDALSSGQKEIISTLYLIWRHTKDQPGIVLIDEPELHLNSEWQVDFLDQLHRIAPHNQYIIATHSEDIFASVSEDRRVILRPSAGGGE